MNCKSDKCCPPKIFVSLPTFCNTFCNVTQTAIISCPEGFHNSIGPDTVSVTVNAFTVCRDTQEQADADAYAQALASAQLLINCVPNPIPDDMPLDQAIYVPQAIFDSEGVFLPDATEVPAGGSSRDAFIAGVRAGYIYKFDPITGAKTSSARFSAPNFGQTSICHVPARAAAGEVPAREEYLLCSFWNEMRADDYFLREATNRKGFFKIDAATLAVLQFVVDPSFFAGDFGELGDSTQDAGPFDLIFYNDFIYCLRSNILKLNPDNLTRLAENYAIPTEGNSSRGFIKVNGDALSDRIWMNCGNQEMVTFPTTPDALSFYGSDTRSYFSCGANFTVVYDPVDHGTVTMGVIGEGVPVGPQTWADALDPNSWYTLTYESGAVFRPSTGKYFIYEGTAIGGFRSGFYTDPGIIAFPLLPGLDDVHFLPFCKLAVDFTGFYSSQAECEAGQAGAGYSIGPGLSGAISAYSHGFIAGDVIAAPLVFRLKRTWVRTATGNTPFNPYGMAHDPIHNRMFVIRNRKDLGAFTVPLIELDTNYDPDWLFIGLGDSDAIPYRLRFNPVDNLIYVPTFKSDKVIRVDPSTLTVKDTFTGFDSPHDVVFTPSRAFAVQYGGVGLKEIV